MNEPLVQAQTRTGVRLAEVVAALSLATDLGTGHPIERSLRSCLLALHFGETLGIDDAALRDGAIAPPTRIAMVG